MTDSRHERLALAALYLIATGPAAGAPASEWDAWLGRIASAVEAGLGLIQLRCKAATTGERRRWLGALRSAAGPNALILVDDDLAAVFDERGRACADGVHLGREDAQALAPATPGQTPLAARRAGIALARDRLGPDLLLGTSTRTVDEIELAVEAGADHVGFGAMAPTTTKQHTIPADPAELARALERFPDLPVFPIGGLGPDNLATRLPEGCARAAVGSAILSAADPAQATARCLATLRSR